MHADYSEDRLVQENAAETFAQLEWDAYLAYDNSTKETLEIFSKENLLVGLQSDNRHVYLGRESQEDILFSDAIPNAKSALF